MKNALTIGLLFFIASCSVREKDSSVVLARVNDQVLTVNSLESLVAPENRSGEQLKSFIHNWVDDALYYGAALKDGLHKDDVLSAKRDRYYKKLIIGSYLQTKTSTSVAVSNSDIRKYYDKNPSGFFRQNNEAYIYHFFTKRHLDARSIRSALLKKQPEEITRELFDLYRVEKKTVKEGFLLKELDLEIFKNTDGSVLGPIRTDSGYHVIKVINKYKKGSKVGLEGVYDKIYQRLLKQRQVAAAADLLDSLKKQSNLFINSNYQ